jgi:hypothetical protein
VPKRGSPQRIKLAYAFLIERDGHMCRVCKYTPKNPNIWELEIDHRDGNENNWAPSNLRLLCRHCNAGLNNGHRTMYLESAKTAGVPANEMVSPQVDYNAGSPEMQVNGACEKPFQRWIVAQVREKGVYYSKDAVNSGAYIFGPSPITMRRYLDELVSPAGPLLEDTDSLKNKVLRLKPQIPNPAQMYLDGSYQTRMEIKHEA